MCSYQPWWLFCTCSYSSLNLLLRLKARSWCWRQRGQQCEFRRNQQRWIEWLFKQTHYFCILCCPGAFCETVSLLLWRGNFVEVAERDTEREGRLSVSVSVSPPRVSLLWFLLQVQDAHPATGIVRVSSQTSQSQLTPASQLQAQLQLLHNTKHFAIREQSTLKVCGKLKLFYSILDVILFW